MNVPQYLQYKGLTPAEFADISKVHFTIVYRCINGKGTTLENANRMIESSEGKITLADLIPKKNVG